MQKKPKLFAFKVSAQQNPIDQTTTGQAKTWAARSGLAVAGCTDPTHQGLVRYTTSRGIDAGVYC